MNSWHAQADSGWWVTRVHFLPYKQGLRELGWLRRRETNWCINCVLMKVMDAVKETLADVSSVSPSSEKIRFDEGLALATASARHSALWQLG